MLTLPTSPPVPRPVAAPGATSDLGGTLIPGSLTNTAPTLGSFSATLTGVDQTVHTTVGSWSVTDATGNDDGWRVGVTASQARADGSTGRGDGDLSIQLRTPATVIPAEGNSAPAGSAPYIGPGTTSDAPATLTLHSTSPQTIANAPANSGRGRGEWVFPADAGATKSLAVMIPADAYAGTYSIALTFTIAPPVS